LESAPGLRGAQAANPAGLWNDIPTAVHKVWIKLSRIIIPSYFQSVALSPEILG